MRVEIDPTPQEVPWTVPLDEDDEHATYDPTQVAAYFAAATRAALVLAEFRAPYRGRSTPVNAWWGSFDLAVNLFSGLPPTRRRTTSSCATRWTPRRSPSAGGPATRATDGAAFYAYAHPAPEGFADAQARRRPAARWDGTSGLYMLDWDDVAAPDPPRRRARLRPLGLPPRLHRLRLGPGLPPPRTTPPVAPTAGRARRAE